MTKSCTGLCSAALIVVVVATVMCVGAMATPHWFKNGNDNLGLWQECKPECHSIVNINDDPGWLNGARALMVLSFIAFILICSLYSCYFRCDHCGRSAMATLQAVLMLTACACVVVSVVILDHHRDQWSSHYPDHSYSFFVACAGSGAYILGALLAVMDICAGD